MIKKNNKNKWIIVAAILALISVPGWVTAEDCKDIGPYDTKLRDGYCEVEAYRGITGGSGGEITDYLMVYRKQVKYNGVQCLPGEHGKDKIEKDDSKTYCGGRCEIKNTAVLHGSWKEACLEKVEEPKKCEEDLGGEWCDVGYSCDGEDITSQASDGLSHPTQVCCKPPGNCKEIPADKPCIKAGGECILGSANCFWGKDRCFPRGSIYTDCQIGSPNSECCCIPPTETCGGLGGEWCDVGYSCDGEDKTADASDAIIHVSQVCCKPPGKCKDIPADKPCIKAGGECIWGSANCDYGKDRCFPKEDIYTDCQIGTSTTSSQCCCIPTGLAVPTTTTTVPGTTPPASGRATCHCSCITGDQTIIINTRGVGKTECCESCGAICGGYTACGDDGTLSDVDPPDCEDSACCGTHCSSCTGDKDSCKKACESTCKLKKTINDIRGLISDVAGIIAAIIFVVYGYKFMASTNPVDRENAKKGIMFVILALIIITVADSLADLLMKTELPTGVADGHKCT